LIGEVAAVICAEIATGAVTREAKIQTATKGYFFMPATIPALDCVAVLQQSDEEFLRFGQWGAAHSENILVPVDAPS
jgi:hypothetical protein